MKYVEESLKAVHDWHRLNANKARCKAADKRASRFTQEDYLKDAEFHTRQANVLEFVIKNWGPK